MRGCTNCQRRASAWNDILVRCAKHSRRACRACERIVEVNRKIEEMHLAMEKLLEERDALASSINDHHDSITQHLPVELISRIFLHALPFSPSIHTFDSDFDDEMHINSVFNIGAVCRAWRTLLHNTPNLWSILAVSLTKKNCTSSIPMIQDWVARSGVVPLYVRLSVEVGLRDAVKDSARQIVKSILLHAERYEAFELVVAPDFEYELDGLISGHHFKHLVHLRVHQYKECSPWNGFHIKASPTILTMAPAYHGSVSIEWHNLTRFISTDVELLFTNDWLQLLRNARRLSVCNLQIMDTFDVEELKDEEEVIHTSLHTLSVQTSPRGFWDRVSFPNLKCLCIGEFDPDDDGSSLLAFQQRSGCSITKLNLGNHHSSGWSPPATASKVLCATPSVEHLTLKNSILHASLFEKINTAIKANATTPFLHHLASLRLCTQAASLSFWSSLLVFLITMTSRQDSSLQVIEIYFEQTITVLEYPRVANKQTFRKLMDTVRGLDFHMTDKAGTDLVDKLRKGYGVS